MLHNITSDYYYIEMTSECIHPSNKIVLTPEGEYVCTVCAAVLTPDEAAERDAYVGQEAVGYIDPKGKTNSWLLGLGSQFDTRSKEGRRLADIARKYNVYGEHDSNFANLISFLNLERYGQRLMDSFHTYAKSKKDYPVAAYLAVMKVNNEYNLDLDSRDVKEAVNKHFKCSLSFIPSVTVQKMCRVAKRFGARLSYQLLLNR